MFQVKVPAWGSGTTVKSFEVVQSPTKPEGSTSKKRKADESSNSQNASTAAPTAKKQKSREVDTSKPKPSPHNAKPHPAKDSPKAQGATQKSEPKNSSNSAPQASRAASSPAPTKSKTHDKPSKPGSIAKKSGDAEKSQKFAGKGQKTDSHPQKPSGPSKAQKKKGGKNKKNKGGKKNRESDSEQDSIDELFGSYGGSDSEVSFTSDEDSMGGIIIKSPTISDKDDSGSEDSDSASSVEVTNKKDDYSSDGFSSEEEGGKSRKKSQLKSNTKGKSSKKFEGSEEEDDDEIFGSSDEDEDSRHPGNALSPKLSALQEQMKAKLEGGRFRFINQKLYTSEGREAFALFQKQPELFDFYHQGYRNQVEKWPENPLDVIINWIKKQPSNWVIADFGCGEARLAQTIAQHRLKSQPKGGSLKTGAEHIHSFDLVARNKFITASDIAHVPLKNGTADVAVFCLSLMGTNVQDFLKEAHRVLKPGGILKIAEVKSRFEKTSTFIEALTQCGFDLKSKDEGNKMFVLFDAVKTERKPVKNTSVTLKPCIYKRR